MSKINSTGQEYVRVLLNLLVKHVYSTSFWNAQPAKPLLKHETSDQPRVKIGTDLFLFNNKDYVIVADYTCSDVTLLFEHLPSRASEIEHFEIFSHLQENKLAQQFFVKSDLLLFFLIC